MTDPLKQDKIELNPLEEQEKYLLQSKTAISQVLNELGKRPEMVTAYFNNGRDYILTVVLAVLRDRNLVVFDYGPDMAQNRRLLEAGRMSCVAKHHDILIRFSVSGLQSARYQGQQVFAAPIPEALFRLQRREYFRVHTPVINPIVCRVPQPQGKSIALPLADISAGGLGMLDPSMQFEAEAGDTIRNCALIFPGEEGSLDIDLKICGIFASGAEKKNPMLRIGASYVDLPMDRHAFLQRYIHRLQVQQKAL